MIAGLLRDIRDFVLYSLLASGVLAVVGLTSLHFKLSAAENPEHVACNITRYREFIGKRDLRDVYLNRIAFDDFELVESLLDDGKDITLRYRGVPIWKERGQSSYETPIFMVTDFPRRGLASYFISYYTCGSGCFTYFLVISKSKNGVCFSVVDYGTHGLPWAGEKKIYSEPEGMEDSGLLEVWDYRFDNYGMPHCPLSALGYPAPRRLLVYEDGGWRVDKPGEFKKYYEDDLRSCFHDNNRDLPSTAVDMAYDMYMLQYPRERVLQELKDMLRPGCKDDTEFLADDVHEKVMSFNPVKNTVLKPPAH